MPSSIARPLRQIPVVVQHDIVFLAGEIAQTQARAIRNALLRANSHQQYLEQTGRALGKYTKQEQERDERKRRKGIIDKHLEPLLSPSGDDAD